jgi:hypothetical protein
MDEASSDELQALLDRLRQGDRAARRLLLERACERLRRLAGRMLHGSFSEVYPSQWSPAYPVSKWPGRRRPEGFWK